MIAYASWPVAGHPADAVHPVHKGVRKAAAQLSLDDFAAQQRLERLSVIKIDTDGHDYEVLAGAERCMTRFRPTVIFEACEYLMKPPRPAFEWLLERRGLRHRGSVDEAARRRALPPQLSRSRRAGYRCRTAGAVAPPLSSGSPPGAGSDAARSASPVATPECCRGAARSALISIVQASRK